MLEGSASSKRRGAQVPNYLNDAVIVAARNEDTLAPVAQQQHHSYLFLKHLCAAARGRQQWLADLVTKCSISGAIIMVYANVQHMHHTDVRAYSYIAEPSTAGVLVQSVGRFCSDPASGVRECTVRLEMLDQSCPLLGRYFDRRSPDAEYTHST